MHPEQPGFKAVDTRAQGKPQSGKPPGHVTPGRGRHKSGAGDILFSFCVTGG
ncbi:hypothetical protein NRE95_003380 [Salmonella enterica]|nr:hypothetical protein [Salmonella enterica]